MNLRGKQNISPLKIPLALSYLKSQKSRFQIRKLYTVRLIEAHRRQYPNDPLPFVYPMVVYSGEKLWDASLEIFPLFGEHESLAREWVFKPYQLLDIQRISDEDLQKHIWSGLMAFVLKNRKKRDFAVFLKKLVPWLNQLVERDPLGTFLGKIVLQYVLNGTEAEETKFFWQQVNYLPPELKGEVMTLAECFKQQGFEKGVQQGEVRLLTDLLQRRFGHIPAIYMQKIARADTQALLQWAEKTLGTITLDEIFV